MNREIEHQHIEWKESWRDEYLKWVCAFANTQGGKLVIGKNDQGLTVGLPKIRKLLDDVPNKIKNMLGIVVDVNLQHDGQAYLEIEVTAHFTPIAYKGKIYSRSGSTLQELNGPALQRFLLGKQGIHWDSVTVPQARFEDLDPAAFKRFRELAQRARRLDEEALQLEDRELLNKLHLLANGQLKRAAILLFHPDPEKYITGSSLQIGYFSAETNEVVYQDEMQGPLILQVDQAMQTLRLKYLRGWISYEGIQRIETYPVPLEALREALLNAVIHKDYSAGIPIQLRIYDHELRLSNKGRMPENWTLETLTSPHSSEPYNPDIAQTFHRAGQIERWGQGVEKIMRLCRQDGLPDPQYAYNGTFTLTLTTHTPPSNMPPGGLSILSSAQEKPLNDREKAADDRVNAKNDRVNTLLSTVGESKEEAQEELNWRAAWEEAQSKAYHRHNPPFNAETGKYEPPEWSNVLVKKAVESFGGVIEVLNLKTGDHESEKRFKQIFETLLSQKKPDEEVLMSHAIIHLKKHYRTQFDTADSYANAERLLADICLYEGLKNPDYAEHLQVGTSTISRYIKTLKKHNIVEFVGAPKTGGYYLTKSFKQKLDQEQG